MTGPFGAGKYSARPPEPVKFAVPQGALQCVVAGSMNKKFVNENQLAAIADSFREQGRKLVLTNGCFDLLHLGHIRYLQAARALGDALAVALNGDPSVRALKGEGRPLNTESDRAEMIAALACVDYVALFPEPRATELLKKVRPSIYVKGGDYTAATLHPEERAVLEEMGAEILILPFEPGHSTSGLIARMKKIPSE
jgi:rfaE bifunctional protein nucleotidyltransferase chain/domain